jgi:hypothetical protein
MVEKERVAGMVRAIEVIDLVREALAVGIRPADLKGVAIRLVIAGQKSDAAAAMR